MRHKHPQAQTALASPTYGSLIDRTEPPLGLLGCGLFLVDPDGNVTHRPGSLTATA